MQHNIHTSVRPGVLKKKITDYFLEEMQKDK